MNTQAVVIEKNLTRRQALDLELKITEKHAARNSGRMPSEFHMRPLPDSKSIEDYVGLYGTSPNR